jgi:hypothetical protein
MLGVLEGIDYEGADQLTHRIGRVRITKIEFTHGESESVFDWNRQTKASVMILHCHKIRSAADLKGNAAQNRTGLNSLLRSLPPATGRMSTATCFPKAEGGINQRHRASELAAPRRIGKAGLRAHTVKAPVSAPRATIFRILGLACPWIHV